MESNTLYELNTKGKVLYIRHGQTYYNLDSIKSKSGVKVNPSYIDSNLTSKGLSQAKDLSKTLSKFTIDKAYTSPLLRCLQTTYYALEHHPNASSIIVYVHPLIIEIVGGMQDWSHNTKEKKEKFNMKSKVKFDWTIFDSYYQGDIKQELCCLEHCDVIDALFEKYIKEAEELVNKGNKDELAKKIGEIITEGLVNRNNKKFETMNHVFMRNILFKQFLLQEINSSSNSTSMTSNSNDDNEKKIIVFTHSGFCKIATSKLAYTLPPNSDTLPNDIYEMKNGECISILINDSTCTPSLSP